MPVGQEVTATILARPRRRAGSGALAALPACASAAWTTAAPSLIAALLFVS